MPSALFHHAQALLFGEKTVSASCCFLAQDMKDVVEALASGLIVVDDLITSRIRLQDVVSKGLQALKDEDHHVKILVGEPFPRL
jgi:(R,R)-butanediol dehydrogenase/meso-butanediol dehydrogenase/diacetyl reductase